MRRVGALLVVLAATLAGCMPARRLPEPLPVTQLEIRAIQTRTYAGQDVRTVLMALLSVLQDDGFLVHYGDVELGLLDASKSVAGFDAGDFSLTLPTRVAGEIVGVSPGVATIEATANVTRFGDRVRVRINFQRRLTDARGTVVAVSQVTDAKGYQEFFTKLDKGLFLQQEGL
jgi:hypothetical protein